MVKLTLDIKKTVEQNAGDYFEKAKKAKKKMEGAKKAVTMHKIKLEELKKQEEIDSKVDETKEIRKKHWYEKFRWFVSSEGFLIVGGRDSTTNEIIVKKHVEKNDLILHSDMAGSPFVIIKIKDPNKKPGETTMQEAADFVAVHSKGWKMGMSTLEVFYVNSDQVTKEANQGEYLPKGAFMIRGKTNYLKPSMNYAIGIYENSIMGAPVSAIKKHCEKYVEIVQGNDKISEVGKVVQHTLGGDLDEIIRTLPPGCKIKKLAKNNSN